MNLNDLLLAKGIDPEHILVLRHRPQAPELNKVLPWLAADRPDVFNAYQQTQGEKVENAMKALSGKGYMASFIGYGPGRALFVGLYAIGESKPLTYDEYWRVPAHLELKKFGMRGFKADRPYILWFDLKPVDFYTHWKGKLVIDWTPPERVWMRRAHRNNMAVTAILEESALVSAMPQWDEIDLAWQELSLLPSSWMTVLAQWRGIYYIFDAADGKGYVGSAAGADNILGRWLGYGATGHGGNKLLRERDPGSFRFSILQRLSPDMEVGDVVRIENSWKERLHTRQPFGLNDN